MWSIIWSLSSRENSDEEVEQHDVANEEVDGEEEGDDVVVVSKVLDVRLEAVAPAKVNLISQITTVTKS